MERAHGGLIHTRGPLRASAFAEPKVEIPLIGPWGPDGLRVQVILGSRTEAAGGTNGSTRTNRPHIEFLTPRPDRATLRELDTANATVSFLTEAKCFGPQCVARMIADLLITSPPGVSPGWPVE